ncbi:MAG TPA: MFS transporter, partial [Anaerolineaceae bacterium]|nr:MFS transporter [Anaerolineaceae bacterium]
PAGALILFVTLGSYALGMTMGQAQGFGSPLPLALLGLALIGLVALLRVESSLPQPMIDLRMFRNRLFSFNLLMGFMVFIVLAGAFILPFFLELVKGYPTPVVGLLMMANPIAMGLTAPLAGALSDRFGTRIISLAGLFLLAVAAYAMTTISVETGPLGIVLRLIPFGIGFGLFQSPNNSAILGSAPRERLGIASGLVALSRTLGNSSGLPLMGAIFTAQVLAASGLPEGIDITTAPPAALVAGINGTYGVATLVVLAAAGLALVGIRLDRRERAAARAVAAEHSAKD